MWTGSLRRVLVFGLFAAGLAGVIAIKATRADVAPPPATAASVAPVAAEPTGRVRLVDLGADRCVPCKAMAPILDELRQEFAPVMQVDVIDVWKNPEAGDPYRIYSIPTQIFFDPSGRELHRHEGFISKADILATWHRLGYPLEPGRGRPGV